MCHESCYKSYNKSSIYKCRRVRSMSTLSRCHSLPDIDTDSGDSETKCHGKGVRIVRGIFTFLNILQGLIGLGCFGLWLFIKFDKTYLRSLFHQVVNQISDDVTPILESSGFSLAEFERNVDIQELLSSVSLVLVIAGIIVLFPVLWGIAASCCMRSWLLTLYSFITIVMVLGEISVVVIFLEKRDLIDTVIKEPFKRSLTERYQGDQGTDTVSIAWNIVMVKFACCGVDGGSDFQNSVFRRDLFLRILGIPYTIGNLQVPLVCCSAFARTNTNAPGRCAQAPIDVRLSHYHKGCYNTLWEYFERYYKEQFIWSFVGFCALQVVCVSLAVYLAHAVKRRLAKENDT